MEPVKSQQPFDSPQHRRVIVHDKNRSGCRHDVALPASSLDLAISKLFVTSSPTFILNLCAGWFGETGAPFGMPTKCLNHYCDQACQAVPHLKPVRPANAPASSPSPGGDGLSPCARLFP